MAKMSMIQREKKRAKLVEKFAAKRKALKAITNDINASEEDKEAARLRIQKMPRDASPTRRRRRCAMTGRPHGNYKKVGLGRNEFRKRAMNGELPGIVKGSW